MPITIASRLDTNLDFIPTGVPSFDKLMGGGFARGKLTLLSGQPSSGKSTVAYGAIAEAQRMGLNVLLYDTEYAYDNEYCESIGIVPEKLSILREEFAEDGLDALLDAIEGNEYQFVIIDSIGALMSRQEAEKTSGERTIGVQAMLTSKFIRKAVPKISLRNISLVCITHEFTDLMTGKVMASGGVKIGYHSSVHARLKQKFNAVLKQGDKKVGKIIVMEMKKNKLVRSEAQEAEAHFLYDDGFSKTQDLLETALDKKVIEKRGNTYYMGNEKLGMISKVRLLLKDDDFAAKLHERVSKKNPA